MKKYILSISLATLQLAAVAQTVNVHFKNGQTIEYPSEKVDYVDFSAKPSDPTVTAGQVVDLGLSVYWASCNLGAETPEEYGNFYAWGETKPKSSYTQGNYSYYNQNTTEYIEIGSDISGTQYDAATNNLGSDWRIPTYNEINELINNCTWEWTQIEGINGYKIMGENGNSIFIPSSGFIADWGPRLYLNEKMGVSVWTSQQLDDRNDEAWFLGETLSRQIGFRNYYKYTGHPIRPVTTNINAGGEPIDHSQDYLVTEKVSASFAGGSIMKINNTIQGSSVLNVVIKNGSSENITLVGIQMNDAANGYTGNNALGEEVEIPAGESKSYGITLGRNMTTPVICFTYRYNNKKYTAEATWNN